MVDVASSKTEARTGRRQERNISTTRRDSTANGSALPAEGYLVVEDPHPDESVLDADLSAGFERDVAPLIGALYQRALGITRNHADAEDLLQDTLLRAFRGFRTFEHGSNFGAWLHRILLNTYISGYRKAKRRPIQYSTEEITDPQFIASARHAPTGLRSAEDQAIERLMDNDVVDALRALPKSFRTAVYYADVEGFPAKEIAAITAAPIGTVTSRLHRGRQQLRLLLADAVEERGYGGARQGRAPDTSAARSA